MGEFEQLHKALIKLRDVIYEELKIKEILNWIMKFL